MRTSLNLLLTAAIALVLNGSLIAADKAVPNEDGFKPLYNGENLDGWIGDTKGYYVEDGKIICDPKKGGNVYTEKKYANFILRFEFLLPEGANNGLGIRMPLQGKTAYDGMELQILDNKAEKYKTLKEWQYHGSLYGVVAAKRGHLKPNGEWNQQEVRVVGDEVEVILNGTSIMKANLAELREKPTLDGKEHPGLANKTGHIGFLGHGAAVEFRNLLIKELPE